MSSINTNDFTRNLSRVLTASDQAKAPTKTDELKPSTFESLLLDTENTEEIENKPKVPAREVPENILTNKEDGEEIPVQKLAPKPSLSYIIGDIPLDEEELSVKIEAPAVNVADVKIAAPPQTPEIVSSKRFSLPKGRELETVLFDKSEIQSIVITAGKYHGVDPNLGLAVAQVESSFKANAVSRDGHHSKGVFQLLDSTAGDMMQKTGMDEPYKPFDPSMNAFLGMGYLRRLHNLFSRDTNLTSSIKIHGANSADELEKIALAAYNAGEGNVARAQKIAVSLGKDPGAFSSIEPHLPQITRGYVKKVGKLKAKFSEIDIAGDSESDELA
jgi:soluble lytic murein transglycosylase-like protein